MSYKNLPKALLASIVFIGGCAAGDAEDTDTSEDAITATTGSFSVLTYNVHGMPDLVTGRDPDEDIPQISPKLNPYDMVVVQKDFVYHDELVSRLTLPHRTDQRGVWYRLGDGLNTFSKFPISGVVRETWQKCHGYIGHRSDCLAPKGLMKSTQELAPGVLVDVYDIHMDAGRSTADIETRNSQVRQLTARIAATSSDRAIIVAGDTSMRESDEPTFQALLQGSRLADACREVRCSEPHRVNRIMFRESARLALSVTEWKAESSFVNDKGEQLSDQLPVKATITWRVR